jgi:hypothetical protein
MAGRVGDISERESCSLCQAITNAVQVCAAASNRGLRPSTLIALEFHAQHKALPRIQVHMEDYVNGLNRLRFFPVLLHKHYKGLENVKSLRIILVRVAPISWDLIRGWYNTCLSEHNKCLRKRIISPLRRIFLIDVCKRKMVDANPMRKFVALSYIWGPPSNKPSLTSSSAIIVGLRQDNSLSVSRIPAVVNDAMEICTRLGQKFLCIGRFCIIQDDAKNKRSQIAIVAAIYEWATLVIVAADTLSMEDPIAGIGDTRSVANFYRYISNVV